MEKSYHHCPSCSSDRSKVIAEETFEKKDYRISRCQGCDLVFTSYQSDDTNEYYGQSHEAWYKKYGHIVEGQIKHDRDLNYLEEVSIIKQFANGGPYLDVGCNAGWLLSYLKEHSKFELYGLEPSKVLSEIASQRLGIKVFNDYVREGILPEKFFEFISMTDVFEHIPNPNTILPILRKALKPGGYLMIKVPNEKFIQLKYRLRYLAAGLMNNTDHFNAKEHLIHYDSKNLKAILEKNGFTVRQAVVPKPIQTRGSSKISILGRAVVHSLAKAKMFPAQDLLVIAQNKI